MIQFPKSAAVGRILPKEAFYKHLQLSTELKDRFISDIKRITVEYSLTNKSLNLQPSKIEEILVLRIDLKKLDFEYKILEKIAHQNKHKILFILQHEDKEQQALYYQRLYKSEWQLTLGEQTQLQGNNLDQIWTNLIEQIAIHQETVKNIADLSIDEKLKRQVEIQNIKREIDKTDTKAWSERQPKKRFELAGKVRQLKKQLEELEQD